MLLMEGGNLLGVRGNLCSLMDWKKPKVDDCGYNEGLFV